jgi:hypothetical protein
LREKQRAGSAKCGGTRTARKMPFVPQDKPALQGKGNDAVDSAKNGDGCRQLLGAQAEAYATENQRESINAYGFVTCSEMLASRIGT